MKLTKNQLNLLLYLEIRAVDYCGRVNLMMMSDADARQAERWGQSGFIGFGRIRAADIIPSRHNPAGGSMWVTLTPEAFDAAHRGRQKRADRTWKERHFHTTEEKRRRGE